MKYITGVTLLMLISLLSCKEQNTMSDDKTNKNTNTTEPYIKFIDDELENIISKNTEIETLVKDKFVWSEGPLWLSSENMVIFTDVPQNIVYSYSDEDGLSEFLKPSGNTGIEEGAKEGANGLLLDSDGAIVLCQHGDRRVAKMDAPLVAPKAEFTSLTSDYKGMKFNSPNDACYHKNGTLFFTDPPYGLTDGLDDSPRKEIPFNGVYSVSPEGKITVIDSSLTKPNGIAFSPDYSKLYVANSDPKMAIWKVYEVDEKMNISTGKIFADFTDQISDSNPGLPDGLKVNSEGYIFATGPGGVIVFSPEAKHLGTIRTGKATANCALNADESELYMTAHTDLMKISLK